MLWVTTLGSSTYLDRSMIIRVLSMALEVLATVAWIPSSRSLGGIISMDTRLCDRLCDPMLVAILVTVQVQV